MEPFSIYSLGVGLFHSMLAYFNSELLFHSNIILHCYVSVVYCFYGLIVFHFIATSQFYWKWVDGYLVYFQFGAIINKYYAKTIVQVFCQLMVLFFLTTFRSFLVVRL